MWNEFVDYITVHPAFGPIIAALITAIAAIWIARRFTQRIKRIEATLEFRKRYQEFLDAQSKLNEEFYFDNNGARINPAPAPTHKDKHIADNLYRRLFDLMLNEFGFFRAGLVDHYAFTEWMRWRWHDFRGASDVTGLSYAQGWQDWKRQPGLHGNPFLDFLDTVHAKPTDSAVDDIVKKYSPRWRHLWRRLIP